MLRFIIIILLSNLSLSASAFWPFDPPKAVIETFPLESARLKAKDKDTRIAFVSDAFLYPVPSPSETFPPPPSSKIGIMYRESQVLLQEAVKDLLVGINGYDLVLFGGSMVANQDHYPLFEDISYDLTKYGLEYYTMIGYGETSGSKPARDLIKKPYYLLTVEDVNLLVLDNVTEKIVPERLPEEASEQYIWLAKTLEDLNNKSAELYIFSYYPLDTATLDLIKAHDKLNIVLLANSGAHKFSIGTNDKSLSEKCPDARHASPSKREFIFVKANADELAQSAEPNKNKANALLDVNEHCEGEHNNADGTFQTGSKYPELNNAALSIYPCAFTVIERLATGKLQIKVVHTRLKGVKSKAQKATNSNHS